MTIGEFMSMALEEDFVTVEIFSCDDGETIAKDLYCNLKDEYEDVVFGSWNCIADFGICFNI